MRKQSRWAWSIALLRPNYLELHLRKGFVSEQPPEFLDSLTPCRENGQLKGPLGSLGTLTNE